MKIKAEIRALRESDDRSAFRCGDADLDRFFQKYAGQNQFRHHIGVTYVAVDPNRILGFATVSAGSILAPTMPAVFRKKLPAYPLPILRLARLAVAETFRGNGCGGALLRFVLELAVKAAEEIACVGVVVDAKPGAEQFYLGYGFMPLEAEEGLSPAKPQPLPMFLSTAKIRLAVR